MIVVKVILSNDNQLTKGKGIYTKIPSLVTNTTFWINVMNKEQFSSSINLAFHRSLFYRVWLYTLK